MPQVIYYMAMHSADMQNDTSSDDEGQSAAEPAENGAQEPGKYLRSTIAFPYAGLKDAEQIARALHDSWGGGATADQLAASPSIDASPRSGAFRVKLATARTFQVTSVSKGTFTLTDLGRKLIDPQTRATARVEAFLTVPLFAALFNEYKGTMLPPDSGLEQKIRDLGVSSKQTAKARQTFQRSAELAGFFKMGKDRLVQPANVPESDKPPAAPKDSKQTEPTIPTAALPAPLPELWLTLLRDGRDWSPEKVQEFVETARALLGLLTKGS
ncbi:MAG TPA: hypothetical protein VK272_01495 [Solirubrobacteraceae bacterium]|nr:hypothetical protein [Solirubrobacteraceae bacterium]